MIYNQAAFGTGGTFPNSQHDLWEHRGCLCGISLVRGSSFGEGVQMVVDGDPLVLQVPINGCPQNWIADVVGGVGLARQVTPLDFVLPLCTSFHPGQPPLNCLFLRLQIQAGVSVAVSLESLCISTHF